MHPKTRLALYALAATALTLSASTAESASLADTGADKITNSRPAHVVH